MPPKYQPDYTYLRHVPLKRVHLFTAIQFMCLAILWVIKTIKSISIVFPLMVNLQHYLLKYLLCLAVLSEHQHPIIQRIGVGRVV